MISDGTDIITVSGTYLSILGQQYNVDVTEIGGYDWLIGIPKEKKDFEELSKKVEEYCEDNELEFKVQMIGGDPIAIEVKGLGQSSDFYQGGKELNSTKGFWNSKPKAYGQC